MWEAPSVARVLHAQTSSCYWSPLGVYIALMLRCCCCGSSFHLVPEWHLQPEHETSDVCAWRSWRFELTNIRGIKQSLPYLYSFSTVVLETKETHQYHYLKIIAIFQAIPENPCIPIIKYRTSLGKPLIRDGFSSPYLSPFPPILPASY